MNSFGAALRVTTFGESHGAGIGCVIDGMPAGVKVDMDFLYSEMDKRRPGKNKLSTQRNEDDAPEILSGVFEGVTTGTPIAVLIRNKDQKSGDYSAVANSFRPGHADFGYMSKYGIRDYRGGGRSSARETAARVAAGAFAKMLLQEFGISVEYGVFQIGSVVAEDEDFAFAEGSEIFGLCVKNEAAMKAAIEEARDAHDSVGGAVKVRIKGVPAGLGEPLYHKFDSELGGLMMGVNGVKAVEIGAGIKASAMKGSQNNDQRTKEGFLSNNAGGILGGISTGQDIELKVYFKPTPSIFVSQQTVNTSGEEQTMNLTGRHDPCIAARGAVVAGAMAALVTADMLLLNATSKLDGLKRIYG
ncbi:MAG: chorismate synthase [Campylobacterales bacterium]